MEIYIEQRKLKAPTSTPTIESKYIHVYIMSE